MGTPVGTAEGFLLDVEPEPAFVSTARMFAAAVARSFEVPEDVVQDIKVVISEACSNAVKAHLAASVGEPIRLRILPEGEVLRFEVADRGRGLNPELSGPPELEIPLDDPAALAESGIGLVLIHALFPDVEIRTDQQSGTTVRFTVPIP